MTGSLDRVLEEALVSLLDAEATAAVQVVPNLLGSQESEAICPRITVWCESQESPDFQEVPGSGGVYGVYPVTTLVTCICEATSATSSDDMEELVSSVDAICIYNGDLATGLTAGELKVFGVVPVGIRQERNGNRLMRHRELTIWARLQPITSEAMLTEDGEVMLTEDGEVMATE
jgi:hypothetical protein